MKSQCVGTLGSWVKMLGSNGSFFFTFCFQHGVNDIIAGVRQYQASLLDSLRNQMTVIFQGHYGIKDQLVRGTRHIWSFWRPFWPSFHYIHAGLYYQGAVYSSWSRENWHCQDCKLCETGCEGLGLVDEPNATTIITLYKPLTRVRTTSGKRWRGR